MTLEKNRVRGNWRRALCGGLATMALVATAVLPARPALAADAPVVLKLSNWLPPAHPLQKAWLEWAEDIKKQSGGTITAISFPSEQLGKAFDHYDMARDGIADFAFVNAGYQPGRFPISGAGELPFLLGNSNGGTAALDAWYRHYAAKEMADTHYCFSFTYDPATIMSRAKIEGPGDMKGLKVRPSNATIGAFDTALGATNIQASAPGARDLLERGTADAVTTPWHSALLFGYDKVVRYAVDFKLGGSMLVWVMNKKAYDNMSAAQKTVIDDHCTTDWAVKLQQPWGEYEAAGKALFEAIPGKVVTKPTPEQIAEWRKAAEPLEAQWADSVKKLGNDPKAILADLHQQLDKYKGGY